MAPTTKAANQKFLFEVSSSNFSFKLDKKVSLSLKIEEGSMKIIPSVVTPKVPNTVKDAPILIPASTSLVPT